MRKENGFGGWEADYYTNGRFHVDEIPPKAYSDQATAYGMALYANTVTEYFTKALTGVKPHLALLS